ncbi:MAG: carboxypeptidase-like regulatory domain-containing protein, partial [Candidatus Korobacteraceae bacterium]
MFRNSQLCSQLAAQDPTAAVPVLRYLTFLMLAFAIVFSPGLTRAQTGSSLINGTVADQSGAVVPGATVVIHNPVSQYTRTTTTDSTGKFTFSNVPINPYHMTVNIAGFAPYAQDVDVRSAVPMDLKVTLQISATAENVTVQGEAGDLVENDPTFHTDIDRQLFSKLPLESTSSELS